MDLLDLLQADGCRTKKVSSKGSGEYSSPCPACGGKDRFHSWPEQGNGGRWWCRGCGKKGDLIQYLRDFRGMGYREACKYLGTDPDMKSSPKWEPAKSRETAAEWCRQAANFLEYSIRSLWTDAGKDALEWLRSERGFSDETIKTFRLGWNPLDQWQDRGAWGLPATEISEKTGKPKKLWLPGGLVIPVGKPEKIKIRRTDPGEGLRYYLLPGSSMQSMVCGTSKNVVFIVESELDAILLHQEAGDLACSVALGSACMRPDSVATGILGAARLIFVALDSDEAGAKEFWQWWKEHFPQSRRWPPIGGKDPGEMFKAGIEIRLWMKAGVEEYLPTQKVQQFEIDWARVRRGIEELIKSEKQTK